ncbi:MAG: hypothetical protein JXL82_01150 [Candidatus Omnitrophica bacterium]|nr:hypothetical protein [Candidatus Omnitrophota bacterium]
MQEDIDDGVWNWDVATITTNGLSALANEAIATSATGIDPLHVVVIVSW